MKPILILILAASLPFAAAAQTPAVTVDAAAADAPESVQTEVPAEPQTETETPGLSVLDAADVTLADLRWQKRPVVIFADTPEDPAFQLQMRFILERPDALLERDVVVITDTDPAAKSEPRQKLRPRGFSLVLIDKDGAVTLRKPLPWDVREITRAIDKMPMRREEIRNQSITN